MSTIPGGVPGSASYPVDVDVAPATEGRNRLTTAFRAILAIPHVLLVGGPLAAGMSGHWIRANGTSFSAGTGGVLGAVAFVCAVIAWFAIVFTARYPNGLWSLAAFYLRWRVRAVAYLMLLRDEYPPFGDDPYPASLVLERPENPERNRLTVAFRFILAIPHFIIIWFLGIAWCFTTVIAWFVILFTGAYPGGLYNFSVGVLRWSTRLEAYMLLLRDEYPPFSLA